MLFNYTVRSTEKIAFLILFIWVYFPCIATPHNCTINCKCFLFEWISPDIPTYLLYCIPLQNSNALRIKGICNKRIDLDVLEF